MPDSPVRWWLQGEAVQNLGDFLSSLLADELFLPVGLDAAAIHVIGSVIDDDFLRGDERRGGVVFWGCGCRDERGLSPELRDRARILAVRGPRSRDTLGLGPEVPLGDPAFLLPALLEPERRSPRTQGRRVVVPHFHDQRSDAELLAASGADVVVRPVVDATHAALVETIDDILSADLVLSASLHAAILAMAWGVPFAFWESGRTDLPFKWDDVAELVGVPATFVGDVVAARAWWEQHARDRVVLPDLLALVSTAPLLVRPDALLRIVRFVSARTAPADQPALLDRAVQAHAAQRRLLDTIAPDLLARRAAAHQLAASREALLDELRDTRTTLDRTRSDLARTDAELERARVDLAASQRDLDQARAWLAASDAHREHLDRQLGELRQRPAPSPDPAALPRPLPIAMPGRLDRARHRSRVAWVNPLFDARWYAAHHPDVGVSRLPPAAHYVRHGRAELRRPNEHFDPTWYLAQHADVRLSGMDPVDHWWFHGAREGRDPGPDFDTDWYLAAHPDVLARGQNPLLHWLREGRGRGLPTRPIPQAPADEPARPTEPPAAPPGPTPAIPSAPAVQSARSAPSAPSPSSPAFPVTPPAPWVPEGAVLARRDPSLVDVPIVLGQPTLEREAGTVTVRCPLGDGRAFWLRVAGPDAILDRLLPRVEPFIAPALLVAGQEGRPLRIVPPLDPIHERHLRLALIPLLGAFTAGTDIVVGRTTDPAAALPPPPTAVVALAFSGGVDSQHALQRIRREGWPPDLLLSIDAGASDADIACRDRRRERVGWVAEQLDVPLVTIDSNLHQLAWIPHSRAHAFRNLGAASILAPVVGTLVYSPGHRIEVTSVPASMARGGDIMEPLTFAAMRWGGMEIHPVGNDISKAYKIAGLIGDPIAERTLDVCVDQSYQATAPAGAPTNCGRCFKCARTLLVIEHLGALDRFAAGFDLAAFESVRVAELERLRTTDFHLDNEARAVLASPKGTLPPLVRGTLPPGPDTADRSPHHAPAVAPVAPGPVAPARLVVGAVTLDRGPGRARLACAVGDGRDIRIEVDGPDELLAGLRPRVEPFVPLALLLAIVERRGLTVTEPLDATFVRRLRGRTVPILAALLSEPDPDVVATTRPDPVPRPAPLGRRALLFSGGVDSFHTLGRMRREGWPPDLLVNLDAGAHDRDRRCWQRRLDRVRGVADALGIPLVTIDTNIHELAWADHSLVHAVRNLATASVLQPVVGTLVYSTNHRLESTSFLDGQALGQDLIEPVTTEMLRWGGLEIVLVGNDVRRIDKVAGLAAEPLAWRYLDVCTDQGYQASAGPDEPTNCGRCRKCAQVQTMLDHLVGLERFDGCFDPAAYAANRPTLLAELETPDSHINDELWQLLSMPRGTLPPFQRGVLSPKANRARGH